MKRLFIVIMSSTALLSATACAQQMDHGLVPPSVTASGEAVITVEPDQAQIDIGVVSQSRNAGDTGKENAEKVSRVVAEVKKTLGDGDEVRTASYSLTPNYRYPHGGKPELTGYTATNILRIKTGMPEKVGRLIDVSMKSGANSIHRLVFTLKEEQGTQLRAVRLASQKAKAKADEIASALGLKIVRILSVKEGAGGIRPITVPLAQASRVEAMVAAPTPVEAGTIEVRSSVILTGELGR